MVIRLAREHQGCGCKPCDWKDQPGEERKVADNEVAQQNVGKCEVVVEKGLAPVGAVVGDTTKDGAHYHDDHDEQWKQFGRHPPDEVEQDQRGADEGEDVPIEGVLRQPDEHIEEKAESDQEQTAADGAFGDLSV